MPGLIWLLPTADAFARERGNTPPSGVRGAIPEVRDCRQLILVTVARWNARDAKIQLFERTDDSFHWREVGPAFLGVTGKSGLGWGVGLHGSGPAGGAIKREGDNKAPAGVFRLHEAFGFAAAVQAGVRSFPYRRLTPTTEAIDDPVSHYYNRVVESASVKKDWKSSEHMLPVGERYRWGVVVEHNWRPFPGFGSCIFLHAWIPGEATTGCTAMPEEKIAALVRWLDRRKQPLLVQLPREEYEKRKRTWHLP